MDTCKDECLTLESLLMEEYPRNPYFVKVEFIVNAIGPTSYDAVFDDASEILFNMRGDFDRFRIKSYQDPHKKSDEDGGAGA